MPLIVPFTSIALIAWRNAISGLSSIASSVVPQSANAFVIFRTVSQYLCFPSSISRIWSKQLGIISNATKKETNQLLTNYGYKYGYGYGYGYGNYSYTYNSYAEEEKENKTKTIKQTKLDKIKSSLLTNSKKIIKIFFKWLDS